MIFGKERPPTEAASYAAKNYVSGALAGGAPAAATGTADAVMEWSAPATPERPTGSLFNRREILRLRGDIRGSAQSLRIGFPRLCIPKTLSVLIGGGNHLTSAQNGGAAMFCPGRLGLAIQVEEPA